VKVDLAFATRPAGLKMKKADLIAKQ